MKQAKLFLDLDSFEPEFLNNDRIEDFLVLAGKKPENKIYIPNDYNEKSSFLSNVAQWNITELDSDILTSFWAIGIFGNDDYDTYDDFMADFKDDNFGKIGLYYANMPKTHSQ